MTGNHILYGKWGEERATQYLEDKGYIILERNRRFRSAEVDIIARDNDFIVFLEVKTRKNDEYGFPEEAVGMAKQDHLLLAAEEYLEENDLDTEIRFDIISITGKPGNEKICHFEDAISPYDV